MQDRHNALVTFNPSAGLTQKLTVGLKGAHSSNGNLNVKCGLWNNRLESGLEYYLSSTKESFCCVLRFP